jgi:hypothetical protein
MCCLITTLLLLGPRVGIVLWWLMQPVRWQTSFTSVAWPILGFLFLPWLTLSWVAVVPGGVVGLDWVLLALALVIDIGSYSGGAYSRRQQSSM